MQILESFAEFGVDGPRTDPGLAPGGRPAIAELGLADPATLSPHHSRHPLSSQGSALHLHAADSFRLVGISVSNPFLAVAT